MPFASRGLVPHPRPESLGNRALLVMVDSQGGYTDLEVLDQTVLVALRHLGFPYRVHDAARGRLTRELLQGCAGVIIAQAHLTGALSSAEAELLASAVVENGLGLVNFDG